MDYKLRRSGKRTTRPERVGQGGDWVGGVTVGVSVAETEGILSCIAGLSRSTETTSLRPFRSMVKCLAVLLTTRNGPSKGGCREVRVASRLRKTWVCKIGRG